LAILRARKGFAPFLRGADFTEERMRLLAIGVDPPQQRS
jgi:hypothetical protein